MYANLDPSNSIEVNQNDAYTLEEPVTTTTNDSYNYPAKFDPSNAIETKENEAYAMNIVTAKNELISQLWVSVGCVMSMNMYI